MNSIEEWQYGLYKRFIELSVSGVQYDMIHVILRQEIEDYELLEEAEGFSDFLETMDNIIQTIKQFGYDIVERK